MHIFITTQFEGFHRWKDAPESVGFLRDIHRHIFHVKVTASVTHAERDIEFILFKREVEEIIQRIQADEDTSQPLSDWSCETWAKAILTALRDRGYNNKMTCEISEDGENGAVVSTEDLLSIWQLN